LLWKATSRSNIGETGEQELLNTSPPGQKNTKLHPRKMLSSCKTKILLPIPYRKVLPATSFAADMEITKTDTAQDMYLI